MYNITLLSSFHMEMGKCNPQELYSIIQEIQPEIIFEELPADIFKTIYAPGYMPQSVEAITIKEYMHDYQIQHFPVDTFEKNSDMFMGYDLIFNQSVEYAELFKYQLSMIDQFGYEFLNSSKAMELIESMQALEERVLLELNDARLLRQYQLDKELHQRRDIEMLKNIYGYSKQHSYGHALFICGAEHRKSIAQLIEVFHENEKIKLNWSFYTN